MDDALLRVSDADRYRAVIALRDHLLVGRLTLGSSPSASTPAPARSGSSCVARTDPVM